jgi:hypothetical protein
MTILNTKALNERANNLDTSGFNGMRLVLVTLALPNAQLDIYFYTTHELNNIVNDFTTNGVPAPQVFPISGGFRVPAGDAVGQVQVTAIAPTANPNMLQLTVTPIGDYSTYTLSIEYQNFDPIFSEIKFKFRPGCFNTDCAPEGEKALPTPVEPAIDYLAKDYDSFRHTMIAAMMQQVPGWQPTSEADLDQVLLELFSVAADELSDYQDRVMNEAYLATARKRVSLARHARLMDYHIHQGNQASTWLAVMVVANQIFTMPRKFQVWTTGEYDHATTIVFMTGQEITPLFTVGTEFQTDLDTNTLSANFRNRFAQKAITLSLNVIVMLKEIDRYWLIIDDDNLLTFFVIRAGERLQVYAPDMHHLLNQAGLYTWNDAIPSLAAGSTQADLKLKTPGETTAKLVQNLIHLRPVTHLLIQEHLNPATGKSTGRNPQKRQLLQLLSGTEGAIALRDPLTNEWFVRVKWRPEDQLKFNYCFTVNCPTEKVEDVSLFHGNLVQVYHGRPATAEFREPGTPPILGVPFEYYERTDDGSERWGTICQLPDRPLSYTNTPAGGEIPPKSTLSVSATAGGSTDSWDEVINLIHSDDSDEEGDRFVVETDELGNSLIRFGNGTNGKRLPKGAIARCEYQVGLGTAGNIGADKLARFDPLFQDRVEGIWNPFDVTDGRDPEPVTEILRRVPEAYRFRQLRAITLQDYVHRAQELPEVSRAAAHYAWTGSWRTVQVAIDPVGMTTLTDDLLQKITRYLDAVRLIGEDLEIRPPRFVPLDIRVALCIHPNYWIEDVRVLLEQEFSEGYTPDGRLAFFHPDRWTFGQTLHASEIVGRIQQIQGVEHVISVRMKRWNAATPGTDEIAVVRPNEILHVRNDPDHMEEGSIQFNIRGGRQ